MASAGIIFAANGTTETTAGRFGIRAAIGITLLAFVFALAFCTGGGLGVGIKRACFAASATVLGVG
ncbi:MAG: hypothetical protein CSA19_00625 [Deltaproteobacteria bacterium]|nr:MAG: hypothetical protein CSA19_00625 [Deltaproteobacteria bacterium]